MASSSRHRGIQSLVNVNSHKSKLTSAEGRLQTRGRLHEDDDTTAAPPPPPSTVGPRWRDSVYSRMDEPLLLGEKQVNKMNTEVPTCTRCCFCIPLRYGLITWAYIKLIANVFIFIMMMCEFYSALPYSLKNSNPDNNEQAIASGIIALMLACQITFNIVLLVGGHKKNVGLLRISCVFTLTVWILTILLTIFLLGLAVLLYTRGHYSSSVWFPVTIFGLSILLEGYFLLLLRSEIVKLANRCDFSFNNHAMNPQCELRVPDKMDGLTINDD